MLLKLKKKKRCRRLGQRDESEQKSGPIENVRGLHLLWLALKMEEGDYEPKRKYT